MSQHTPGPFEISDRVNAIGAHYQIVSLAPPDALGNRPATSILASSYDDALRIVRALNTFDELLAACEDALGHLQHIFSAGDPLIQKLTAAIAEARPHAADCPCAWCKVERDNATETPTQHKEPI